MNPMDYIAKQAPKLKPSKESLIKMGTSYVTSPTYRVGLEAGIGMATGIVGAGLDKEDDTVGSTIGKGIVAAGAGYAMTEGALIAAGKYARSEHAAKTLVNFAADKIPALGLDKLDDAGKLTVGKMVNQGAKKVLPTMNRKMGIGGAGMAAGLIMTMMNGKDDGIGDTSMNLLTGAGIALMGAEVYSHQKGKKNKVERMDKKVSDIREMIQKKGAAFLETNTGKASLGVISDVLKTPSAKALSKDLEKLFGTDAGKGVSTLFENLFKGDMKALRGMDANKLLNDVDTFTKGLNDYFTSDRGATVSKAVGVETGNKVRDKLVSTGHQKAIAGLEDDVAKLVGGHMDKVKNGLVGLQNFYKQDTKAIQKLMNEIGGENLSNKIDHMMTTQADEAIKKIDTHMEKEAKQGADKKVKDMDHADTESTKVADNTEKKSKVTAGDVQKKDLKAKSHAKLQKLKVGGVAGLGVFALATVMDVDNSLREDKMASRMTEKQEQNLNRKLKKQEREENKLGYGYINFGEMAIDMFNERTGHHKMGNAKFQ